MNSTRTDQSPQEEPQTAKRAAPVATGKNTPAGFPVGRRSRERTIHDHLRLRRQALGFTQMDIGDLIGMPGKDSGKMVDHVEDGNILYASRVIPYLRLLDFLESLDPDFLEVIKANAWRMRMYP